MPKARSRRSAAAPRKGEDDKRSRSAGDTLSLLNQGPMLDRLKATATDGFASLSANQEVARDAVGKVVAALAHPDMPVNTQQRRELITKCGELLATLDRLQSLLLQGEHRTLQSLDKLDKASELLHQLDRRAKA